MSRDPADKEIPAHPRAMSTQPAARGKTTPASNSGSFKTYAHGVPEVDLDPGADPFTDGFGASTPPAAQVDQTETAEEIENEDDLSPSFTEIALRAVSPTDDQAPHKVTCPHGDYTATASTHSGATDALNMHLASEHGMDITALASREIVTAQTPIAGHTQPDSRGMVTFFGERANSLVAVDRDSEEYRILRAEYLRQNPPGAQADGSWRPYWTVEPHVRATMRDQIGRMNVLAISGGRITPIEDGIELPVSSGYKVRVHLHPNDTYVVERVMTRGTKTFYKGRRENVYADELHQVAYYASCFRNDEYDDPDNWL